MTLLDDLKRLARDYGFPADRLTRIDADPDGATFAWFDDEAFARTCTVPLNARPNLPDVGTPIYDEMLGEVR